jgi:YfiH family protein
MSTALPLISPNWPAPPHIHAVCTTRNGGSSQPPYDSLNLGDHVGDDPIAVAQNRQILSDAILLAASPCWITQVHGIRAVNTQDWQAGDEADAIYSTTVNTVCAVMTADCLPILLCDKKGQYVAAIHAGWRGLADGIIEATIANAPCDPKQIMAWLGPAIGPTAFEAGNDVRDVFLANNAADTIGFTAINAQKWWVDMYVIACQRLSALGVSDVYGEPDCTVLNPDRFFSFRREGDTGRMASLIWIAED